MYKVFCLLLVLVSATRAAHLPFIAGGKEVDPVGKWPWQGSIQFLSKGHICSCIVLSETWMLSAASCFALPSLSTVLLGVHDIHTRTKGSPTHFRIAEYIKHPDYSAKGYDEPDLNDIGVIRLASPADLNNPFIQAAVLAPADNSQIFTDCYITGWGVARIEDVLPLPVNTLREAKACVISNAACDAAFEWRDAEKGLIHDTHLCISGLSGACFFDNGGPVVCRPNPGDAYMVVGVMAAKGELCFGVFPTVSTRVSKYRGWITDATDGDIPIA